jgi:UDP-N-acetylmuramyl pentapeptide phosphotransferase/UDP-N-acetylglucosamine-1-phosphate transferase
MAVLDGGVVRVSVISLIAGVAAAPVVLWRLRHHQILDLPNERSSHASPTPRGGGLVIGIGALAGLLAAGVPYRSSLGLVVAAVGFGAIGLIDDLRSSRPASRFGGQLVTATASMAVFGPRFSLVFWIVALVWIVSFVNAFNFMDGINGLATFQAILAGAALAFLGVHQDVPVLAVGGAALAAASVAFLPLNFPVARLFLGDVGSYLAGGWIATLIVVAVSAGAPAEAVFAPVSLFVVDTGTTLVGRVRRRERWYEAHRSHVYQRLIPADASHTLPAWSLAATIAALTALGLAGIGSSTLTRVVADALILTILSGYLSLPSLRARRRPSTASLDS